MDTGGTGGGTTECYRCGSVGDARAEACTTCHAQFLRMCECGATCRVHDAVCPACGVSQRVRTRSKGKVRSLRIVRAAKWGAGVVAAGVLVTGVVVALGAFRTVPVGKLREQGVRDFNSQRYADALPRLASVAERDPRDAVVRYLQAACYARLGYEPGIYLPFARSAIAVDPGFAPARMLLAQAASSSGDLDTALAHAMAAAEGRDPNAEALLFAAESELRRPQPDLTRAMGCLERAGAAGCTAPALKILLAETALRAYGGIPGHGTSLPSSTAAALRDAETACAKLDFGGVPGAGALTLSRIQLALGRAPEALTTAQNALQRLPPASADPLAADLRFVRAAALVSSGDRTEGHAAFRALLDGRRDAGTAAAIASYLVNVGDAAVAETLVAEIAAKADATGGLHAVLASVILARARRESSAGSALEAAARAIAEARTLRPEDATYATIAGDVAAAAKDWDAARRAYADAERAAPELAAPKVRRCLLCLTLPEDERALAVTAAVEGLQRFGATHAPDPALQCALGRLHLGIDRVDDARRAFERATELSPADPAAWTGLAEAWRRTDSESAPAERLRCLARARDVAPHDPVLAATEASARLVSGDATGAVAVCNRFLAVAPDDRPMLDLRARAHAALGQWEDAARDLRRLVESGEADSATMALLTTAEIRSGHPERAVRVVHDAKEAARDHVTRAVQVAAALSASDPRAAVRRLAEEGADVVAAQALLALGETDAAVATLRRVLDAARVDIDALDGRDRDTASCLLVLSLLDVPEATADRIAEARGVLERAAPTARTGLVALMRGRVLLAEDQVHEALAELGRAADLMPDDPLTLAFHGEVLFRKGSRTEGLASFRRAVVMPGAPASLRRQFSARLVVASRDTRQPAASEALAREALRVDPGSAMAANRLAQVLCNRGEFRQACEVVEKALAAPELPPADARVLRYRAAIARYGAGDAEDTVRLLDALPESDRASVFASTLRALADVGRGRLDEAQKVLEPLVAANPDDAFAVTALAALHVARADDVAVAALLDRWRASQPRETGVQFAVLRLLLSRGRTAAALGEAEACAAANPGDVHAAAFVAEALRRLGRRSEALRRTEEFQASASGTARVPARLLLCQVVCGLAGDGRRALEIARSLQSDPESDEAARREARVLEAEALLVHGNVADAAATSRAIAAGWPASGTAPPEDARFEARVRFVLGVDAAGDPARQGAALANLSRVLELEPQHADAANDLAWVLAGQAAATKDATTARRARDYAARATSLAPDDPSFWDTRAAAALAAGDVADAEASWKRSLDLHTARSASGAAPGPARARTALRYARFLGERSRKSEAAGIASAARAFPGADATLLNELEQFLAENERR